MDFSIERKISNLIENQFPSFYKEDGKGFILFMKAYYEWLESTGNPVYHSRRLLDYRDVDNTIEDFLEAFQKKYVYGIPVNVIINKRFLIKHILDVYRSKSSIQGYKLLFRILYNEDVEIYLPGVDILRVSDGTWKQPKYLELSQNDNLFSFEGYEIQGLYSGTTALVETVIKENFYRDTINTAYISNILPRGGDFVPGEKIVLKSEVSNTEAIASAPTVLGSLNSLEILNGGQNFNIGNILKISKRDINDINNVISFGQNGYVRVTEVTRALGAINFILIKPGFGFLANSQVLVYNGDGDDTGSGASFDLGVLSDTQSIEYNTDILCDYMDMQLDAVSYGFPANSSANLTSSFEDYLSYETATFGSILVLTNISTGNGYTTPVNVFVRSTILSNNLTGTISYDNTSNTISGTSTIFDDIFANGDVIHITANASLANTGEYAVIKEVVSNTEITLYGPPSLNSTASAEYRAAPVILPANFAIYEDVMVREDGTINGKNELIQGLSSSGNNVVGSVAIVDSGKGYAEGEVVTLYLHGGISTPSIDQAGVNYSNGDVLVFSGGGTTSPATGFVSTNTSGSITSVSLTYAGSGYSTIPIISVKSSNGSGASLSTTLTEFNTTSAVTGRVRKNGIGMAKGHWTTTRGFLNSDKYIQDSYYYQDYSYEIKIAKAFDKYRDILQSTFHTAGSEFFGRYLKIDTTESPISVLYANTVIE